MVLNPSNSSNLEQLALKGLNTTSIDTVQTVQCVPKVKQSKVDLYSALLWRSSSLKRSDVARVSKAITQFYLSPTHEPYLPLLLAAGHHRPLAGTHCAYPRRDGQAELTWVAGYDVSCTGSWTLDRSRIPVY